MTALPIQVGDRVRRMKGLPNNRAYLVGVEPFEVRELRNDFVDEEVLAVDQHNQRHHLDSLELVGRATVAADVPPVEEYRDPAYETQLRVNADLNAVIRRRNEMIDDLRKQVDAIGNYGEILSQVGIEGFVEGVKVLEAGARLHALGVSFDDVQRWHEQEQAEEMRVLRRIRERKTAEEES